RRKRQHPQGPVSELSSRALGEPSNYAARSLATILGRHQLNEVSIAGLARGICCPIHLANAGRKGRKDFSATRNPGVSQDPHRPGRGGSTPPSGRSLSDGLQTLTVKLRLLPGRNTVQVRGNPPISERIKAKV